MSAATLNHAAAMRRLEALFNDTVVIDTKPDIQIEVDSKVSRNCDVHGTKGGPQQGRRGSLGNALHAGSRRDSVGCVATLKGQYPQQPAGYFGSNNMGPRRESMPALNHYGYRRGSLTIPHNLPSEKKVEHPSQFASSLRRDSLGSSHGSLNRPLHGSKRDLLGGSQSSLNGSKNYLQVPLTGYHQMRRNSRNYSTDSLDGGKRNSWDPGRRGSSGSSRT
ncbi:unnamed protein product [Callosobruchus maculatus]|uniref:Uncharacterized protein n=1 Tax=Callosobruchus maculatus TaxID=64391 RepID=A0A653BND0_CALMS|nr:unnamed protein product [Callosobruchus maculatus]